MRRIAFLFLALPPAHAGDGPLKAQLDQIARLVTGRPIEGIAQRTGGQYQWRTKP